MRHLRATLVCGLLAMSAIGCTDNNSSLFVVQVQARTPENECVVNNDPSALSRSRGLLDVGIAGSYQASLLVGNQLVRTGDSDRLRVETGRVQIISAEVEIYDAPTGGLVSSYEQAASGFIDVSSGTDPGFGLTSVTLVDPNAAAVYVGAGSTGVLARVRLLGETLGGAEVETGPWDFPIDICTCCTPIIVAATAEDDLIDNCQPGIDGEPVDSRSLTSGTCGAP